MLGGCETAETVTDYFKKPIILPCPDFRILADAAYYTTYRPGPGRDLTDVDVEGNFDNMRLGCLTKIDKKTRIGIMEVDVILDFAAQRGPANTTRKAVFPYFVSVTDLDKKILYREEFKVSVDFPGNQTGLGFRNEPITLELPLKPELTGENYIVFTGFKLTREQLDQNRARRRQVTR
jgi:hypothetical protein